LNDDLKSQLVGEGKGKLGTGSRLERGEKKGGGSSFGERKRWKKS